MNVEQLWWFVGRRDVHALQTQGGAYLPVAQPIDDDLLQQHLDGTCTLGSYTVEGTSVKHIVIDIDSPDLNDALRQAGHVQTVLTGAGIPQHWLELSGGKGYHVWLLLAEPMPAGDARDIGQAVVRLAGLDPATEVFPKQTEVPPGGYGNLVKLPSGVHRKTGAFSQIVARPTHGTHVQPEQLRKFLALALFWKQEREQEEQRQRFGVKVRGGQGFFDRRIADVTSAQQGGRNHALYRAAFSLYSRVKEGRYGEDEVTAALTEAGKGVGLTAREVKATLRSAKRGAGLAHDG